MNAKTILASALAAALGASSTAIAADLTVNYGDSVTIDADTTYDTVIVNGDLTVAANVTLTASKLFISQNNSGHRATVTLQDGATITMPSWTPSDRDVRCIIGDASPATFTMNAGSTFTASEIRAAKDISGAASDGLPPVLFVLNDALVDCTEFSERNTWSGGEALAIHLNGSSAVLYPANFALFGKNQRARIFFNGGLVRIDKWFNYGNSAAIRLPNGGQRLYLESVEGNPIRFDFYGGSSGKVLFGSESDSIITTVGTGAFQLERRMATPKPLISLKAGESNSKVVFNHTGGFRVAKNANLLFNADTASSFAAAANSALCIEAGGYADLAGVDVELASVYGVVSNSTGTACTLTIGGDDSNSGYPASLPAGVTLVKAGAGNLSAFAGTADSLSIQGGILSLIGRAEMGYPFYKFNIRGTVNTGTSNHRVQISEFKFLDGETDVTQGWDAYYYENHDTSSYNQPTAMWDGDVNTDFYDQRDQSWSSISNCAPVLEYCPSRKVTGYTWYTGNDWNRRRDNYPVSWAVFGSADNVNWTQLDAVDGFSLANPGLREWCGTNFVCAYAPTAATIASLAVASGAALAVDGADITVSAVTAASGVPVSLAHGAVLALPAATEVASLSVDVDAGGGTLTNFRPASGGAVYLAGDIAKPRSCVLPVSVGSLLGGNLSTWDVFANGSKVDSAEVFVNADGFLETRSNAATVVIMR